MPLLNYTTEVHVRRSVAEIHAALVEAGARQVMASYDAQGRAEGVAFTLQTIHGLRAFLLPVKTESVLAVLKRDRTVAPRYKTLEQAERVAWRILKDWIKAQLAIIETEMVTIDQVMLPYMQAEDGRTVYELYLEDQLLALPAANLTTG